jgi:NAD(P)-dependent dehydrogenase (short-subunit alcohol dehydrogenase family)
MSSPTILITGARRGIGFAAARQLADRGARIIISSRNAARAEAAANTFGGPALSVALDLTNPSCTEAAAEAVERHAGHLDVLVNNTAVLLDHEGLMSLPPDILRERLETNVIGSSGRNP